MIHKKLNFDERGDFSSFKVPEGYFEGLTSKIDMLIEKAESEKSDILFTEKETVSKKKIDFRPLLYMAAMFVLLLFSITFVLKLNLDDSNEQAGLMKTSTTDVKQVLTAEEYLINTVGTYGITEYYIDPDLFEE